MTPLVVRYDDVLGRRAACGLAAIGLAPLGAIGAELWARLLVAAVFLGAAAVLGRASRRSAATVTVDESGIRYERQDVGLLFEPRDVLAVQVDRASRPLKEASSVGLRVRLPDREAVLPVAAWMFDGRAALSTAARLAVAVGARVDDPVGERWRASRWAVVRWRGEGREGRLVLVGLGIVAALAVVLIAAS